MTSPQPYQTTEASVASTPESPPNTSPGMRPRLWRLVKNLVVAFRLACFLPLRNSRLDATWWQVFAFALLGTIAPTLFAFPQVGLKGQVMWYSLPGALMQVPLALLAAIVCAYAVRDAKKSLVFLQAFLMALAAVDVLVFALWAVAGQVFGNARWLRGLSNAGYNAALAWPVLACAVAAARLADTTALRRLALFGVCAVTLGLPMTEAYRDRSLWERAADDDADKRRDAWLAPAKEDNFYAQPRLLERELAALAPGRPGIVELYFIGMAGDASQDVFKREVDAVAKLFSERFDAGGRVVRLINNAKTIADTPMASLTGLTAALARIAAVMNADEDILFLFLTSHGSKDHKFTLQFWPLQFNDLTPQSLREALDASGIKRRVIVVSACYSGGFVDALKNDDTLVIAASGPDRNSFGCSNEAEWTYFGKAYFDEALRKTYSFNEAFSAALPIIAAREKAEDYTPSEPQIALGKAIRAPLDELAARLSVARPRARVESKTGSVN